MRKLRKATLKFKKKVKKNLKISLSSHAANPIYFDESERYNRGIEHLIDQNMYNY
jgi:hypothetical protein